MQRNPVHKKKRLRYWLFIRIPFWLMVGCLAAVLLFKWVPVRYTPLMLQRSIAYRSDPTFHTQKVWVPIDSVSTEAIWVIILAEDTKFATHRGINFYNMEMALERHRKEGAPLAGFSTISQQTAKNVFTRGRRSYFRKAAETGWMLLIEWIWGKRRILEVYLNVAEMGKGIYGIEAASQAYYHIPARDLNLDQAIAMATCLPYPLLKHPLDEPDAKRQDKAATIKKQISRYTAYPFWLRQH